MVLDGFTTTINKQKYKHKQVRFEMTTAKQCFENLEIMEVEITLRNGCFGG
jgi:hypothetical protein